MGMLKLKGKNPQKIDQILTGGFSFEIGARFGLCDCKDIIHSGGIYRKAHANTVCEVTVPVRGVLKLERSF